MFFIINHALQLRSINFGGVYFIFEIQNMLNIFFAIKQKIFSI